MCVCMRTVQIESRSAEKQGRRRSMEDRSIMIDRLDTLPLHSSSSFYAVYVDT